MEESEGCEDDDGIQHGIKRKAREDADMHMAMTRAAIYRPPRCMRACFALLSLALVKAL